MAKILQAEDLGPRPSLRSNRPVVTDRSGEIEAQGLVNLAQTVSAIAKGMLRREDKLTYAKAKSDFLASDIDIRRDLYESDDFENWEDNYVERITKVMDTAAKDIKSNYDRALFQQETRLHIKTESIRLDVEKGRRQAIHGRATLDELLETNRSKALSMDDTFDHQPIIDNTLDAIKAAHSKRYIDEEQATNIWQAWRESYAEGFVELLDLGQRIEQLSNPEGTVLEFLQPDRRNVLLNRAEAAAAAQQNQIRLDIERQRILAERELKARQEQQASDFVTSLNDPDAEPLTYQDVIDSDLTSTQKLKFIGILDKEGEGQAHRTNWVIYNELFGKVATGDIHPDNITDEVLPFLGQGITSQNYSTLRTLAGSVTTQEGEPAIVKGFLAQAKSQITKSTLFGSDPNGDRLYYEFTFKFMQEFERQKADGKSVDDLLDPESKDYMGKLVRSYVRTPQQQLNDMANDLRRVQEPPDVEARKADETPEQYLKRVSQ